MKSLKILLVAGLVFFTYNSYALNRIAPRFGARDSVNYITLTGKVIDKSTKSPVVFASVFQTGKSVGTITNSDGEFILKISDNKPGTSITITYLGYSNKEVNIQELQSVNSIILLETTSIPIDEVVIKSVDALELLKRALAKVSKNYPQNPEMQKAFYRETIKQNRSYVSISEAVIDIYNAGYGQGFDYDRLKIYKGRKSKDVKKMDTVLVKFQGGPRTAMFLDVIKNPSLVLDPEMLAYYDYNLIGAIMLNDRKNYIVEFWQKSIVDYPLYRGKIYIDLESEAITGIDFQISEESLPAASQVLVKKKPSGMHMEVLNGNYLVKYRLIDEKWCLNYVRSEVTFRSKWEKKFFKSTIATMFEMAITDRDTENIEKYSAKESIKISDVLADQVSAFEDDNFWGEYNTIKPDESIEVAIQKLNKKLKR